MTVQSHSSNPLHSRAILTAEERKMLATMAQNNPQKPFDEVAQATGLAPELLRKLVREGALQGWAPYREEGVKGYCDIDQAKMLAVRLAEARRPVEGNGIQAIEAAEKYGFSAATIYKWNKDGWVKVAQGEGKRDRLFNEGDIAFARALADLCGQVPGKPIFPPKTYSRRPKS